MKRYETVTIIDADLNEEQRAPVLDRVKETIGQKEGLLVAEDAWGARRLAYEIKKKNRGFYVRFDYCGDGAMVNEIERFFRIDDRVLKYLTIVLDEQVDLEKVKEEIAASKPEESAEAAPAAEPDAEAGSDAPKEAAPQGAETETAEDENKEE